jgi:hypothetical protein
LAFPGSLPKGLIRALPDMNTGEAGKDTEICPPPQVFNSL